MSLADLVAAGAPELPDGWFYRVKSESFYLTVELRKRRRVGSGFYASARVREDDFPDDAAAAVVDACRRAVANMDELAAQQARYVAVDAFVGDHDPRRKR